MRSWGLENVNHIVTENKDFDDGNITTKFKVGVFGKHTKSTLKNCKFQKLENTLFWGFLSVKCGKINNKYKD